MITLELLHNMVTEELQNLFFNHLKKLCKPLGGAGGEGSVLNSAHLAPGQPSDAIRLEQTALMLSARCPPQEADWK